MLERTASLSSGNRSLGVVAKDIVIGVGGLGFDFQAGQIEYSVALLDSTEEIPLKKKKKSILVLLSHVPGKPTTHIHPGLTYCLAFCFHDAGIIEDNQTLNIIFKNTTMRYWGSNLNQQLLKLRGYLYLK